MVEAVLEMKEDIDMSTWNELRKKQKEEVNAFPIHFAFGYEQIEQKIKDLNLSKDPKKRAEQIVPIGAGGFVLKDDYPALLDMFKRHQKEREEAIAADTTGDGIIYEMFYAELKNCEYGYTGDYADTLEHLGYSMTDIEADTRLKNGLEKAAMKIRKEEGAEW